MSDVINTINLHNKNGAYRLKKAQTEEMKLGVQEGRTDPLTSQILRTRESFGDWARHRSCSDSARSLRCRRAIIRTEGGAGGGGALAPESSGLPSAGIYQISPLNMLAVLNELKTKGFL